MDFCVRTETLTTVERAEMETAGGNYCYCLRRSVAFERQFRMCKLVHSCTLSESNFSTVEEQLSKERSMLMGVLNR